MRNLFKQLNTLEIVICLAVVLTGAIVIFLLLTRTPTPEPSGISVKFPAAHIKFNPDGTYYVCKPDGAIQGFSCTLEK